MPNITLDIFARLHQTTLRRTEKEAQQRFQQLGQMAADELTQGIEKAAPRIRRAMSSAADATVDYTRKTRDLGKAQKERNTLVQRGIQLENDIATQRARNAQLLKTEAVLEQNLKSVRREQEKLGKDTLSQEREIDALRRKHNKTVADLAQEESKLKDIRLQAASGVKGAGKKALEYDKALQPLRKQNKRETAELRDAEWILAQTRGDLAGKTADLSTFDKELTEIRKEQTSGTKALESAEGDLVKTRQSASKQGQDLVRLNEDFVKSTRKREEAIRQLAEAESADEKRRAKANGGRKKRGGIGVIGNMLTDLPFVPSGPAGAVMGSGVIVTLASAAEAAVTASQALAVLPAVAAAGAAAIGTLAMGFNGFGDALKHMGDPKKWAQDLATLSPAAQQAALEIQYLVDGPLGDLQDATQETLFSGVAEQLHTLTDNLLPEAQTLTQGISQSFNNMFGNAVGQIISPGSQASINAIIDNIVTSFQKLEPAVAPFVSAITKITETGSSFLPGFAEAITNAANSFNNFITNAQDNGELATFIQKGIDAARVLGDVIWDVGQRIFDVFGNKDPEEFRQTLESMVDAAFAVADAIVGISHVVNDLLKFVQPIADALGGWENLIKVAGGAFLAWKTMGVISTVGELVTGLGMGATGVGGALSAIPALAGGATSAIMGVTAVVAALGISIGVAMDGFAKWDAATAEFANRKGDPGVNVLPPRVQGPGITPPTPLLPGSPGSPGSVTGGNPLDAISPTPAPIGPTVDYKSLYPTAPAPLPPPPGSTAGLPGYADKPVPAVPPEKVPKVSDKDRRDAIRAGLPADFGAVDPFGPMGGPTPGSMPMMPQSSGGPLSLGQMLTGAAGLPNSGAGSVGGGVVDPQKVYEANNRVQSEAWDVQDAARDLEVLKRDNLATQDEIVAADRKLTEQKWQLQGAQADLVKAQQGSKGSGSGSKLGAGLDNDLGASRGLAGLADNLVRLVGALGTAPLMNQLQGIVDADPNKGGFGLMGILGAQGAFGPRFTGQGQQSALGYGGYSPSYGAPTGGGEPYAMPNGSNSGGYGGNGVQFPPWVNQMAQTFGLKPSTYAGHQEDRGQGNQGIDWSGPVENMQAFAEYLLSIKGAPGLEDVIWENPNTKQKIGVNQGRQVGVPGSADPGYFRNDFADHENHVHTTQEMSLPIPGGGGSPIGSAPNWDALAALEAGGNWQSNSGNGFFGGLQFDQPTWDSAGGGQYAERADLASREQQISVGQAEMNRRGGPESLWPENYSALGQPSMQAPMSVGMPAMPSFGSGMPGNLPIPLPVIIVGGGGVPSAPAGVPGAPPGVPGAPLHAGMPPAPGAPPPVIGLPGTGAGPLPGPTDWGNPGIPAGMPGGGGQGPMFGSNPAGPGAGASGGTPPIGGPQQGPVGKGAGTGGWQPQGGGGIGPSGGGAIGMAMDAGSMALDVMAPGSGQAAQTAMKLVNRSIQYGGQLASVGVGGLLETFGLSDTELGDPSKSWLGRAASGIAGAAPAVPTTAGQSKPPAEPPKAEGQQQGGQQGPTVSIGQFVQAPNRNGQQTAKDLAAKAHGAWTKP